MEVPIVRIGDLILITLPNDNGGRFIGKCGSLQVDGAACGDLPFAIWKDIESKNGELYFPELYKVDSQPISGLLALYQAPKPEENGGTYSNPKAPGLVKIKASILVAHQFAQSENPELEICVIGIKPDVIRKNGSGSIAVGESVILEATIDSGANKSSNNYDNYIQWSVDGKFIAHGKKVEIVFFDEGSHVVQAWVGLSRTKCHIVKVGNSSKSVDSQEVEREVISLLLDKRSALHGDLKAYIDEQGKSWKEFRINQWGRESHTAMHLKQFPPTLFFSNQSINDKGQIIDFDQVKGWIHAPELFTSGSGTSSSSPTINVPLGGLVRLHALAGDLDIFKQVTCQFGGISLPENKDFGKFGNRYEQRFGSPLSYEWDAAGAGVISEDISSLEPLLITESDKNKSGSYLLKCKIEDVGNHESKDAFTEQVLTVNIFRPDLEAQGSHRKKPDLSEINVNDNDNNQNGTPDLEDQEVIGEDDLAEVSLRIINGKPKTGMVRIEWVSEYLNLWKCETKGNDNRQMEVPMGTISIEEGVEVKMASAEFNVNQFGDNDVITLWFECIGVPDSHETLLPIKAYYVSDNGDVYPGDEIEIKVVCKNIDMQVFWPGEKEKIAEAIEESPGCICAPGIRKKLIIKKYSSDYDQSFLKISCSEGGDSIKVFDSEVEGNQIYLPKIVSMSEIDKSGYVIWVVCRDVGVSFSIECEIVETQENISNSNEDNDHDGEKEKEGEGER